MTNKKCTSEIGHKLWKKYILALSILTITLLFSQLIIHYSLSLQINDSRVVNIAGRQRMLSQKISKAAFGVYLSVGVDELEGYIDELATSSQLWAKSYEGLQDGSEELGLPGNNSKVVRDMFNEIETEHAAIVKATAQILQIASVSGFYREALVPLIEIIKENEPTFLQGMDKIVFQYDLEAKQKVRRIRYIEIAILLVSLLILALEAIFIFRPAKNQVEHAIAEREESEHLLFQERELLRTTLLSLDEGLITTDENGRIAIINRRAEQLTGWSESDARGEQLDNVFQIIDQTAQEKSVDPVENILNSSGNKIYLPEHTMLVSKDNTKRYIAGNASGTFHENGEITGFVLTFMDVTKELEQEKEIEGFLNINLDMLCVGDMKGNFVKVNKKFEDVLGYKPNEIEGKSFMDFVHKDDAAITLEALNTLDENSLITGLINRYRCKDGSYKYIEWNSLHGEGKYIYTSARDVTEKMLYEEKLKKLATKDELTGLYNRHYLDMVIGEKTQHADAFDEPMSMIMFDLDHFKNVNDKWGHPAGDELLKQTSKTAAACLRATDILVRHGGEEFVVIMPQTTLNGALLVAEKVRAAIQKKANPVCGEQTASIGVAERMKGESFIHWYRRADESLYCAKQNGRNCVRIAEEPDDLYLFPRYVAWKNEWLSGNPSIDLQHQEILESAYKFVEISLSGVGKQEDEIFIEELLTQIKDHFIDEEKILQKIKYPEVQEHVKLHISLITRAEHLKEAFLLGGIKPSAFFSFLMDDLITGHLIADDVKYFPYII